MVARTGQAGKPIGIFGDMSCGKCRGRNTVFVVGQRFHLTNGDVEVEIRASCDHGGSGQPADTRIVSGTRWDDLVLQTGNIDAAARAIFDGRNPFAVASAVNVDDGLTVGERCFVTSDLYKGHGVIDQLSVDGERALVLHGPGSRHWFARKNVAVSIFDNIPDKPAPPRLPYTSKRVDQLRNGDVFTSSDPDARRDDAVVVLSIAEGTKAKHMRRISFRDEAADYYNSTELHQNDVVRVYGNEYDDLPM